MTVRAWRIVKAKHAATAFTGDGARKFGGRWNSPGRAVVYTSGSISLALLEMLVHLQSQDLLRRYLLFEVTFEEALVTAVEPRTLPRTWRRAPNPAAVPRIGDAWLKGGASAVLRVPSAIVPSESNYLLSPGHADYGQIAIGPKRPVQFDPRLAKGV